MGLLEFDISADVLWEATGEQLRFLQWCESTSVRCPGLEQLRVGLHRGGEGEARQLGKVIGVEGRAEPLLTELFERLPLRASRIMFQVQVPLPGCPLEVVRRKPDTI